MPAPYVKSVIEDQSTRVPAPTGISAGIVIEAKKGPINEPVLVTSQSQLLNWFTPNQVINIGWDLAYYSAFFYLRDSNRLWVVRAANNPLYGGLLLKTSTSEFDNIGVAEGFADPEMYEFGEDDAILIYGTNPGAYNNAISIKVETDPSKVKLDDAFIIYVYNENKLVETHYCSRNPEAKDGYGRNMFVEDVLEGSNYIAAISNPVIATSVLPKAQGTTTLSKNALNLNGGSDGEAVQDGQRITALKTLENVNNISVQLIMDGGNTTEVYHRAIVDLCSARDEATYGILSTPYEDEIGMEAVTNLVSYRNETLNLNTYLAGLYTPHQKVYDEFNDRYIYVDPSAFVAGAISKSATNYGYHFPAAGYNRGIINTIDVVRSFLPGEVDVLSEAQINTIISDPSRGIVIYDQQTLLSKASDLQEQSISNMINLNLRPSLKEFLKDYLFELNDEITRSNIVAKIETYMDAEKANRAVYDYYVVCDETNNTANDIQSKNLNVWLYIKPTQPAKFIEQRIIITPYAVSFESLLQAA